MVGTGTLQSHAELSRSGLGVQRTEHSPGSGSAVLPELDQVQCRRERGSSWFACLTRLRVGFLRSWMRQEEFSNFLDEIKELDAGTPKCLVEIY